MAIPYGIYDTQANRGAVFVGTQKKEEKASPRHKNLRKSSTWRIDRVTVAEELARHNELGHDGLAYLTSLDEGMPHLPHLDAYVRIIRDKSTLRHGVFVAQKLANECLLETAAPNEILAGHLAEIQELSRRGGTTGQAIAGLPTIRECGVASAIEYLHEPELPRGALIAFTGDSGSGKSTLLLSWAAEISAAGTPVLILDRENPISAIVERFGRLGILDERLLRYWGGWRPEEPPQPDDPRVIAWVKSCELRPLVIVDSMIAFHGGDENDAGETRAFIQRCRTIADLGGKAAVIHHDGKSDTAKDYRGSSDFKAAVDAAFHVSNSGPDGRLGIIRLRCFKSRFGFAGEILYHYRGGRFERDLDATAPSRTVADQLASLLRTNPGATVVEFERLAVDCDLGRARARTFLTDGVLSGAIRREKGAGRVMRHFLAGEANG
jgi:energy-coupling factor transporter ATP-binding protein EcfA2